MKLQQRKTQVLTFITRCVASNGEAPTIAEIGRQVGLSSSASVFNILRELENDGSIRRSRRARGIEIATTTKDQVRGAVAERMGGAPLARDRGRRSGSAPLLSVRREVRS